MDVILLAAGIGIRTALNYPKQFYPINGKPCLVMSLEIFDSMDEFDRIIITCNKDNKKDYEKILKDYKIKKAIIVEGGETRQASVFNALNIKTLPISNNKTNTNLLLIISSFLLYRYYRKVAFIRI